MKRFTLPNIFLSLVAIIAIGAGCVKTEKPTTSTNTAVSNAKAVVQTVTATLTIKANDEPRTYTLALPSGSAVLDLLKEAEAKYAIGLEITDSSYGPFVQTIFGKSGGEGGKYWLYSVNETDASVGVRDQKVQEGDRIAFRFE